MIWMRLFGWLGKSARWVLSHWLYILVLPAVVALAVAAHKYAALVAPLEVSGEWAVALVILLELEAARHSHREDAELAKQTAEASKEAVIETRRAAEASLFSDLVSEYGSMAMQRAIRSLYRWKEAHPKDFEEQFIALLKDPNPNRERDRLDEYRRYTYRYFHKVKICSQRKLTDIALMGFALNSEIVIEFLTEILEPMQRCHSEVRTRSKQYDRALFDYYRKHYAQYLARPNDATPYSGH